MPALPPGAIVKSQPKAMSASVAVEQQGSVSMGHITTRKHGDIPGWGSHHGPCECPGSVQDLVPPLTRNNILSSRPCALPRQHSGAGPGGGGVGKPTPGHECWRADPDTGTEVSLLIPLTVGKVAHKP